MPQTKLPPPPDLEDPGFKGWLFRLWKRVTDTVWLTFGITGTPGTIPGFDGTTGEAQELTRTGTGTVVAMQTSPTLITPVLGAATGTSLELGGGTALTTTNRTGTGNLVLANTPTLTTPAIGAATGTSLALGGGTALATTNRTGTGNLVLENTPTLVTPVIGAATGTSIALGGGTALSTTNRTGTGNLVLETSPTLVTPNIGAATGTSLAAAGLIKSSSATAGIGYATGAGGAVTQNTAKNATVTINKACGQITMDNAALNAGTAVAFQVTNTMVDTTDVVHVCIDSVGTVGSYLVCVSGVGVDQFNVTLYNCSAGNLSEAVVLNYAVIKGVTS